MTLFKPVYLINASETITLMISGDKDYYYFGIKEGEVTKILTKIRNELLATEVTASPFTGVMYGFIRRIKQKVSLSTRSFK